MGTDNRQQDLLQERDELYLELSRLREIDNSALEKAKVVLKKKDEKIKQQDEQIKQLTGIRLILLSKIKQRGHIDYRQMWLRKFENWTNNGAFT